MCQTIPKHVLLMKVQASTLKTKQFHDRTVQPVVNRDESGHEQTMLNEVDIDFRIHGSPHSVVKHAQSSRDRELVKKIENHLIDKIFNSIYNKTKPTTRSVRPQRK